MILERILASEIKGQKIDVELGVATAIIGPNAAGKTAILEAIKFVCRGKFPEIKKGSWPELTVTGEFDDGTAIIRSINSKGTVQTSAGDEGGSIDPSDLDIPLLDPEHYFGLTDRERVNYVFERVKLPDSFTRSGIISEIERLNFGKEHSEEVENAKKDLISELRVVWESLEISVQEALASNLETLRSRYTYWNRRCKETQGAVTTLTELKLRQQNVTAAPADLDEQIKTAVKALSESNRRHGAKRQELLEVESKIATKKSLEGFLAEDRDDFDTAIKNVKIKQTETGAEFERLSDSIAGIDIEALESAFKEANQMHSGACEQLAVLKEAVKSHETALAGLERAEQCPYCLGNEKGWKEKARKGLKSDLAKAKQSELAQTGIKDGSAKRLDDLTEKIKNFRDTRAKMEPLRQEMARRLKEVERLYADQTRDQEKRERWKSDLAKLQGPIDAKSIQKELDKLDGEIKAAQAKVDELNNIRTTETRLQQDVVRAQESAQENTLATAQLFVTKKVAKLIEEKREYLVHEVFAGLLTTANQFCDGILKSPLVLMDGVIGRLHDPTMTFISHHWFSGTEKAIAYIAIATSLSARLPFKLVLLDEFGRLDESNQVKVIKRLVAMQKDKIIDQFIIAGTSVPKGTDSFLLPPRYKMTLIEVK